MQVPIKMIYHGRYVLDKPKLTNLNTSAKFETNIVSINNISAWCLVKKSRSLKTPDNSLIRLTLAEYKLFFTLSKCKNNQASHLQLFNAVNNSKLTRLNKNEYMRLVMIISRTRQKFSNQGVYLPLLSIRKYGYEFADNAITVDY